MGLGSGFRVAPRLITEPDEDTWVLLGLCDSVSLYESHYFDVYGGLCPDPLNPKP